MDSATRTSSSSHQPLPKRSKMTGKFEQIDSTDNNWPANVYHEDPIVCLQNVIKHYSVGLCLIDLFVVSRKLFKEFSNVHFQLVVESLVNEESIVAHNTTEGVFVYWMGQMCLSDPGVTMFHCNAAFHVAHRTVNPDTKWEEIPFLQRYEGTDSGFDAQFPEAEYPESLATLQSRLADPSMYYRFGSNVEPFVSAVLRSALLETKMPNEGERQVLLSRDDFATRSSTTALPRILTGPLGDICVSVGPHHSSKNVWLVVTLKKSTATAAQFERNLPQVVGEMVEMFGAKGAVVGQKAKSIRFYRGILTNFVRWWLISLNVTTGQFAVKKLSVDVSVVDSMLNWTSPASDVPFSQVSVVFRHLCGWLKELKDDVTAEMLATRQISLNSSAGCST